MGVAEERLAAERKEQSLFKWTGSRKHNVLKCYHSQAQLHRWDAHKHLLLDLLMCQ